MWRRPAVVWDGEVVAVGTAFPRERDARVRKIVAELELDKLVLEEGLSHLKPRA